MQFGDDDESFDIDEEGDFLVAALHAEQLLGEVSGPSTAAHGNGQPMGGARRRCFDLQPQSQGTEDSEQDEPAISLSNSTSKEQFAAASSKDFRDGAAFSRLVAENSKKATQSSSQSEAPDSSVRMSSQSSRPVSDDQCNGSNILESADRSTTESWSSSLSVLRTPVSNLSTYNAIRTPVSNISTSDVLRIPVANQSTSSAIRLPASSFPTSNALRTPVSTSAFTPMTDSPTLGSFRTPGINPSTSSALRTPSTSNALRTPVSNLSVINYDEGRGISNSSDRVPSVVLDRYATSSVPQPCTPVTRRTSVSTPLSSRSVTSSSLSSGKRKRKFPGPAGVLPKLKSGLSLEDMSLFKPATPRAVTHRPPEADLGCSQGVDGRFSMGPWKRMTEELEPQAKKITDEFNVDTIIQWAGKKQLPRGKVPVVCVLIDTLNIQNAEASVVLRDPSGVMKGTLHRQVMKEYAEDMTVGTVLVLRQVGVFSPTPRSHYLNVTPNNIVRIYRKAEGDEDYQAKTVSGFSSEDYIIPQPAPPPSVGSPVPGTSISEGIQSPGQIRGIRPAPYRCPMGDNRTGMLIPRTATPLWNGSATAGARNQTVTSGIRFTTPGNLPRHRIVSGSVSGHRLQGSSPAYRPREAVCTGTSCQGISTPPRLSSGAGFDRRANSATSSGGSTVFKVPTTPGASVNRVPPCSSGAHQMAALASSPATINTSGRPQQMAQQVMSSSPFNAPSKPPQMAAPAKPPLGSNANVLNRSVSSIVTPPRTNDFSPRGTADGSNIRGASVQPATHSSSASETRFNFRQIPHNKSPVSPQAGMTPPPGSARNPVAASTSKSAIHNPQRHLTEDLWQDDHLDDLLSDLGEEMMQDF